MDSSVVVPVVANGVAVCAIVFGWRQNRDNLANQRRLADLGHVRGLLDDAAIALHRGACVLDEVRSQVAQHTPKFFTSDKGTEVFTELGRCGEELDALLERLRIRFGSDHRVVTSLNSADAALLDIHRAAGLVRLKPDDDGSPVAAHAIREFYDDTMSRLLAQRERYDRTRKDFIDAAYVVAGAQLSVS
jgi:hypothetical protein